ncbi:hypothetical protein GCM10011611_28880 [Aliidongia dinghuensis]|uniref:Ice-binding protein C-terminal domain-containing protein n=1 Tax=Aliidongia dinghuensis TaxID=1867774 RepID=A0A8J2YTU5_9PROT|nr:PEP-CTERM sorting domain-containing protein [Aliidongia dinghuensis]GGF21003.1 hypothetical protein GCM10011611_28880 [Aliidongia dinghuensis]
MTHRIHRAGARAAKPGLATLCATSALLVLPQSPAFAGLITGNVTVNGNSNAGSWNISSYLPTSASNTITSATALLTFSDVSPGFSSMYNSSSGYQYTGSSCTSYGWYGCDSYNYYYLNNSYENLSETQDVVKVAAGKDSVSGADTMHSSGYYQTGSSSSQSGNSILTTNYYQQTTVNDPTFSVALTLSNATLAELANGDLAYSFQTTSGAVRLNSAELTFSGTSTSVPEPGALALLAGGIAGLGALVARRRKTG